MAMPTPADMIIKKLSFINTMKKGMQRIPFFCRVSEKSFADTFPSYL